MTAEAIAENGSDDLATRKAFVAKELEVVALLHKAGVPFLAGTDTPPGVYIFPGFSLHEELQRFVDAGFTPLEALQTATINPAKFFKMEEQMGTIETGKLADMVLLDANPLKDIANTQKIQAVFANGHCFSRAGPGADPGEGGRHREEGRSSSASRRDLLSEWPEGKLRAREDPLRVLLARRSSATPAAPDALRGYLRSCCG